MTRFKCTIHRPDSSADNAPIEPLKLEYEASDVVELLAKIRSEHGKDCAVLLELI